VGQLYASFLNNKFSKKFLIQKINPWDSLNQLNIPNNNTLPFYQFNIPVNKSQYGAFVITNSDNKSQIYSFDIKNDHSNLNNIELFQVSFVRSINNTLIPDALIPIEGKIEIKP